MGKLVNILVATDYSEEIMNAEHYAIQLAKTEGFFLRFLHVFEPPGSNQTGSFDAEKIDYSPALHELKKLKEHVLSLLSSMGCKPGEINFECLVREGDVTKQIVDEINESFPDFVLMGTHGGSGFREFVLGTHTVAVIRKAGVPVFAIPRDALFTGIKRIVYATEYREGELPVINFLTQFAGRYNAEITVLHISANMLEEGSEKKMRADFEAEIRKRITYPKLHLQVEHATEVIRGIDDFNETHETDLLVMSHEKPGFLAKIFNVHGGYTKMLSVHSKVPLLVIPDHYNPDFSWFWRLFAMDYSLDNDF